MTAGFLANINDDGKLAEQAGITIPLIEPTAADKIIIDELVVPMERPLDLEAWFEPESANVLLEAVSDDRRFAFLTRSANGQLFVLNSHTFSEADFEAVGEVLLCPRPLGLVELPQQWANTLRGVFNDDLGLLLDAPSRVTMQPLENGDIVLHNYNREEVILRIAGMDFNEYSDALAGGNLSIGNQSINLDMGPRSRIWLTRTGQ